MGFNPWKFELHFNRRTMQNVQNRRASLRRNIEKLQSSFANKNKDNKKCNLETLRKKAILGYAKH